MVMINAVECRPISMIYFKNLFIFKCMEVDGNNNKKETFSCEH